MVFYETLLNAVRFKINPQNRQGFQSDIWALGAVILEILLDKKLWDIGALRKGADQTNIFDVLRY